MATINSLFDNFDDNAVASKWTLNVFSGGSAAEQNGRIEMVTATTGTDTALNESAADGAYSLLGSIWSVELVSAGNQALASLVIKAARFADATSSVYFLIQAGNISAFSGAEGLKGTVAYNSTNHRWLRIRESGGTTFWETSADGKIWAAFYSVVNATHGVNLGSSSFVEQAIESGAEASTTTVIFDNVNFPPYLANRKTLSPIGTRIGSRQARDN